MTGQKILKKLIFEITNKGGKVIEADTDGSDLYWLEADS